MDLPGDAHYYHHYHYDYRNIDTDRMDQVGLLPGFGHACSEWIFHFELESHYCILPVYLSRKRVQFCWRRILCVLTI